MGNYGFYVGSAVTLSLLILLLQFFTVLLQARTMLHEIRKS